MSEDTFDLKALTDELTLDEGKSHAPYIDTKGFVTIGIGRNLTSNGLSDTEIALLFANDVRACCTVLDTHITWWRSLPQPAQRVILNLCFNMGWPTFSQFNTFLQCMQTHQWHVAADDLTTTLWYKEVGTRGPRMCQRLMSIEVTDATS